MKSILILIAKLFKSYWNVNEHLYTINFTLIPIWVKTMIKWIHLYLLYKFIWLPKLKIKDFFHQLCEIIKIKKWLYPQKL